MKNNLSVCEFLRLAIMSDCHSHLFNSPGFDPWVRRHRIEPYANTLGYLILDHVGSESATLDLGQIKKGSKTLF
jgi:hypothetical protein